jgi:hypothetical protein
MGDWLSYSLSDFLLFSPRAYWRMFELHNAAWWPLPLVTMTAGLAALALAIWRPRHHGRWIAFILAVLWAWVAWSFLWQRYAEINWVARYVAPLFALQAALFLMIGTWHDRLRFDRRGAIGLIGLALIAFAIFGYPLLAPAFGRNLTGAEIFGVAPDPTAIGTLGLLLARGRWTFGLLPIPLLWCAPSGATLWAMEGA